MIRNNILRNKTIFCIISIVILLCFLLVYLYTRETFVINVKENEINDEIKNIYTAIIVEPRQHKALAFILENFLENLSHEWNVIIFHGNKNETFLDNIIKNNLSSYKSRIKKINLRVVSYVVPRVNLSSGTVYDQFDGNYNSTFTSYSGKDSLKQSNFYVLTSNFGVYKCIFNNNASASTQEPLGQDITTITTSDGYVWKYLYTIPLSAQNRFLKEQFMPVQRAVTNAFYSKGEVSSIVIDSSGSGYNSNALVTLSVQGEFTGGSGNSIANIRPVLNTSGEFIKILIDAPGAKYKSANILISDTSNSGRSQYNNISNVSIYSTGAGYFTNVRNNTTVTISTSGNVQPSGNAFATLVYGQTSNSIVGVTLTNKGSGYTTQARQNTTITIATTGNGTNFGNITSTTTYIAGCSNNTRGLSAGGYSGCASNAIEYITIATTGNATDFGDLTVARPQLSGAASTTRGLFAAGGGYNDTIDYVTIATTGNAIDFGDLHAAFEQPGSICNAHGGIAA